MDNRYSFGYDGHYVESDDLDDLLAVINGVLARQTRGQEANVDITRLRAENAELRTETAALRHHLEARPVETPAEYAALLAGLRAQLAEAHRDAAAVREAWFHKTGQLFGVKAKRAKKVRRGRR